jgi:hypothetical protein
MRGKKKVVRKGEAREYSILARKLSKNSKRTVSSMKTLGNNLIMTGQMGPTFTTSVYPWSIQVNHGVIFFPCIPSKLITDLIVHKTNLICLLLIVFVLDSILVLVLLVMV